MISVGVMPLVSMLTLLVFVLPLLPMVPMQRGQLTRAGCPLVSLIGPIFRPGPRAMLVFLVHEVLASLFCMFTEAVVPRLALASGLYFCLSRIFDQLAAFR